MCVCALCVSVVQKKSCRVAHRMYSQVLCQPRPPPSTNSVGSGSGGGAAGTGALTPSRATSSRSGSQPNKQVKRIESEGLALIVAAGFLYDTPCNR